MNHLTLPQWVLTPPTSFIKRKGQGLLPSPLRDLPLADPPASDPYWKSLRGWENYETVREFIKFVTKIVQELKDQVDYWVTICEPVASVIGLGYIAGLWPPGFLLDGDRARTVLHNLIEAHVQAYDRITSLDNVDVDGDGISKMVGFAHAMVAVCAAEPTKILGVVLNNNIEAASNFDYFVNDYFINAVVNGEEDINYLNTLQRHNEKSTDFIVHGNWKNKVDFIGINYYRRVYVRHSNIVALSSARFIGGPFVNNLHKQTHYQHHSFLNDLGWEIYPQGLYDMIMRIKNRRNNKIPIFITENGVADQNDAYRAPFIIAHLQQTKRALDEGASVIGYLYWSFMDNYEWLDNYRPQGKFGLFSIDLQSDKDLSRYNTKGVEAYKLIINESIKDNEGGQIANHAIPDAKKRFGSFSSDGVELTHNG